MKVNIILKCLYCGKESADSIELKDFSSTCVKTIVTDSLCDNCKQKLLNVENVAFSAKTEIDDVKNKLERIKSIL